MKRTSLFIVGMLVGTSIGLGVTTMITRDHVCQGSRS